MMDIDTPRPGLAGTGSAGFTLVELMIATVLLVIGALGFIGALFASQMMVRSTKEYNRANAAMVSAMEEFRQECVKDFHLALLNHAGTTTYQRKFELNAAGEPVAIDLISRVTTSQPNADNHDLVDQIQAKGIPGGTSPLDEVALASALVLARTAATVANLNVGLAEEAMVMALPGTEALLQAVVDAKREIQRQADAEVDRLESQEAALAEAKSGAGSTPSTQLRPSDLLRNQLVNDFRLGSITQADAEAQWAASGDGSPLIFNGDGSIESALARVFSDGTTATEAFRSLADGSSTTSISRSFLDGTSQNTILSFLQTATQVVAQVVGLDGRVATKIDSTREVTTPILPADRVEIVDLELVSRIAPESVMRVIVVVDETALVPPMDLNGDGDAIDENVPVNELTAAVLRVVVEWPSANGKREIESTTVIARGDL